MSRLLRRLGTTLGAATVLGLLGVQSLPAYAENWDGGPGADTHHGTDGADLLRGFEGADSLYGAGGADTVEGGSGNDEVFGGTGEDRVFGGPGADRVVGGDGPDTVDGGVGQDLLVGAQGNDRIQARDGNRDVIDCGPGEDTAFLDWRDDLHDNAGCEHVRRPDITYGDLTAMFPGKVASADQVRPALDRLNAQMRIGKIGRTPNRVAAFLTTLANESTMRYDAVQPGSDPYRGRGYIQLTSSGNYGAAGNYFDINLLGEPGKAASLTWSPRIARWYWTVARPGLNAAADNHDMGAVSAGIGYGGDVHAEDADRCGDYKHAMAYLTGHRPADNAVDCFRD
jgi:predicted chitinase